MPTHHDIDPYPIPKEKSPRFINEPWLVDGTILDNAEGKTLEELKNPELEEDNIRIYVPIDLNKVAILRRLNGLIYHLGEINGKW